MRCSLVHAYVYTDAVVWVIQYTGWFSSGHSGRKCSIYSMYIELGLSTTPTACAPSHKHTCIHTVCMFVPDEIEE